MPDVNFLSINFSRTFHFTLCLIFLHFISLVSAIFLTNFFSRTLLFLISFFFFFSSFFFNLNPLHKQSIFSFSSIPVCVCTRDFQLVLSALDYLALISSLYSHVFVSFFIYFCFLDFSWKWSLSSSIAHVLRMLNDYSSMYILMPPHWSIDFFPSLSLSLRVGH